MVELKLKPIPIVELPKWHASHVHIFCSDIQWSPCCQLQWLLLSPHHSWYFSNIWHGWPMPSFLKHFLLLASMKSHWLLLLSLLFRLSDCVLLNLFTLKDSGPNPERLLFSIYTLPEWSHPSPGLNSMHVWRFPSLQFLPWLLSGFPSSHNKLSVWPFFLDNRIINISPGKICFSSNFPHQSTTSSYPSQKSRNYLWFLCFPMSHAQYFNESYNLYLRKNPQYPFLSVSISNTLI